MLNKLKVFSLVTIVFVSLSCSIFQPKAAEVENLPISTEVPAAEDYAETEVFVDYHLVNWKSDFSPEDLESNWKVAFDGSAIFGNQGVTDEDVSMSSDSNALRVEANTKNKSGVFMNAIAYRDMKVFPEHATYTLSGYFKVPEGIGAQHIINVAFNFVDSNEVGHSAEIFWGLDPNITGMSTGHVNVRNANGQHVSLYELPGDADWHKFVLVATANLRDGVYTIDSIAVDEFSQELGWEMPTFAKPGWPSIAQVYLEQHNSYRCEAGNNCVGVALWKEISLSTEIH